MKKKTLLLLASTILSVGVLSDISVEAASYQSANGAIIMQLPQDNTRELMDIGNDLQSFEQRFEKQLAFIKYFEKRLDFKQSDFYFQELVGMVKELDDSEQKNDIIQKVNQYLREETFFQPNNARIQYRLSVWQRNFGSIQEAYDLLRKAINIDKTNPHYLFEYSQYALDKNEYDKAIKIIESLKRHYPRELEYRIGLAKAYTQAGKYEDAVREYRVASAFDPANNETIIALNELNNYSKVARYSGGQFYDPMTAVKPVASPSGQKVVAFDASTPKSNVVATQSVVNKQPAYTAERKQIVTTQRPAVATQTRVTQAEKVAVDKNVKDVSNKVKKAPGTKRVMVSYINGRKVVKIVNINTTADTSQSLQDASKTFATQLAESNSGYDLSASKQTQTLPEEQYSFKTERTPVSSQTTAFEQTEQTKTEIKPVADKKQVQQVSTQPVKPTTNVEVQKKVQPAVKQEVKPEVKSEVKQDVQPTTSTKVTIDSYPTTSKYQVNEKDYATTNVPVHNKVAETTPSGDPSVKALTYKPTGRKQLLITYKNGKKVVQMVSPEGTPMSMVNASEKLEKEQNKNQKKADKKKEKQNDKINQDKQPKAVEKTNIKSQNNKDNTDFYIKANEFLAQQQYQSAIDVLKQVQPATLRSLTAMASCYNALGQTDMAIDYYLQADKLAPSNTQILYSLGYLYYTKNDVESAKKYVNAALEASPENPNALQLKKYMSQQETNEATNKAVSYLNEGKYAESKKILEKSLVDNPSDFQSYYYLGHIAYATQKYEDATRNFATAIKYNPEYALSYYSLGLAYDKLKEFNKSIAAYEQFLKIELDDNKYTQYAKTRINTIKSKQ